ncbi:hypothetical protein F1536_12375 [Achromobacter xylosoxidans]|jgi:hypothetical protein|uniref:hypothetical protein n=1 Tax=Alcaligenes xylosoxydans xylosoxydans TaxID=85698 RepID=UPI000DD12646|nr:hypothetical protein [Achromobacter xylosoxidans]AXA79061.1 hypothetical protein CE206_22750 [Achromobacter xylosoxidans]KAA5926343.1 hypothetical protein F1536_12375 [Achromobacter xylosoxidans]KAF4271973.1 hypothetical protein CNMCM8686_004741 [Aspergillus fumigatus]QEQ24736.1 hypothetical protein F0U64_21380 [Achromobacter xylosoxidans]
MTTAVEIHGGGSNNEDRYSKTPGVEHRDNGYIGFVAVSADRPTGVKTRNVYAVNVRATYSEAMADAGWLVTQIDIDNYV